MKIFFYTIALAVLIWQPITSKAETLDKLSALQQALQNNPSYKAALSQINAKKGSLRQASLIPNPDAMFEVENFAGEDAREGFDSAEITFGIEQKIEIGGKRRNRIEVADFSYKIAQEQAMVQALSLLSETEFAFIRTAVAKERISLADKRLNLADKTLEIVKKRINAAKAADIQRTKADIEKSSAVIEKRTAKKEYVTARNDLARLLGLADSSSLDVDADLSALPEMVSKQILLDALNNAPLEKIQKFSKMQARASLNLAKSSAIPDPTIGIGIRRFNENDDTALLATLSFPIPVFNRNQGSVQEARANLITADAQAHAAGLSLRQSALRAWEEFSLALDETRRYKDEIIPSARKAYSQADVGYIRGAFSFLDLLDAQRTLNNVQKDYLDSTIRLYEAKSQTDFLLGKHTDLVEQYSLKNNKGHNDE